MIKKGSRKQTGKQPTQEKGLADSVQQAMKNYFRDLDGHQANNLYSFFMGEVEKPFFEVVMQYTNGNIAHASQILGINRSTLRNRLKKYDIDIK